MDKRLVALLVVYLVERMVGLKVYLVVVYLVERWALLKVVMSVA